MHEFRIPLRWSDLDTLNHVNNVRFVDYAAEARADMAAAGLLRSVDGGPRRIDVSFLAPLALQRGDVLVSSRVEGGDVLQEVVSGVGDDRIVHASLTAGPGDALDPAAPAGAVSHPYRLRLTDVGRDGHVTEAAIVEMFQEARIKAFWGARGTSGGNLGPFAVAGLQQHYSGDLAWSAHPVTMGSTVVEIGTKSALIRGVVTAGDRCVATAEVTIVAFDGSTQRSRVITDDERTVLASMQAA